MKKIALPILGIAFLFACNPTQKTEETMKLTYPKTKKVDTVDVYFGTKVADPYRWLEDDNSEETKAWVKEENKVTDDYLAKIQFRDKIAKRLTKLMDYPKQSAPFENGGKYFYYKNNGLQNQSVLMVQNSLEDTAEILLDPNSLSDDGTVSLAGIDVTDDGKYLVYSIARSGSDWNEIYVRDIETKKDIDEHLVWVKFSGISCYDGGFYYSGYDEPKDGDALTQANQFQRLYYHKIGTAQADDKIIMEDKENPLTMYGGSVSEDKHFLFVYQGELGTKGSIVYGKDLTKENSEFIKLNNEYGYDWYIVENIGNTLILKTNENAPKGKLMKLKFGEQSYNDAEEFIPEKDLVLDGTSFAGGKMFLSYMKDAQSKIEAYDLDGKYLYDVKLPAIGSASLPSGKKDKDIAFYSFTSFTYPSVIYKYSVSENKSEIFYKSEIDFDIEDYETKQIFYESKDGTKIPMFIVHKKGIKLDGNNPTLLYGYGGFNISLTPSFSVTRLIWLENGGVFAMANLRGGGEYGEDWHDAGTKLKKQNVFDDFIAAAKYLIKEKYTNPEKLAIQGGSNGGLLIGAVINQQPDLFKVALPAVGVMDMLRFHKFTIGSAWVYDYGSSDDEEQFKYLLGYSPLHNISDTANYPAVLVTTADHDDRVVPAHSFKYIATLQEKYKGNNPVLIRIESKAGHGGGKPTDKVIEEYADIYSFIFYNMGIEVYKDK